MSILAREALNNLLRVRHCTVCAKQHSEPGSDKRGAKVDELHLTPLELIRVLSPNQRNFPFFENQQLLRCHSNGRLVDT
jgi:hypothetical protein